MKVDCSLSYLANVAVHLLSALTIGGDDLSDDDAIAAEHDEERNEIRQKRVDPIPQSVETKERSLRRKGGQNQLHSGSIQSPQA